MELSAENELKDIQIRELQIKLQQLESEKMNSFTVPDV